MGITDLIGLVGVLLVVIAYFFLQTSRWASTSLAYSGFNALGAAMIVYSLLFKWNLSAFVMEGTWLLLSLYGVWKAVKK